MSEVIPKIGLAIEGYKARQQDIIGLGHRAYKDLFAAANASMLTAVVQRTILQTYSEMVTVTPPRTSLLAAVSQQHGEIIAGCRVLTEDDDILSALIDAANAATTEAFHLIYAERLVVAASSGSGVNAQVALATPEQSPARKTRRAVRKPASKKTKAA
ncbi:MAG: hypothetical protein JO279_17860 [Verrucomicrobia bacterium]|nr:hypothetical protein [Verrucomicrobiota bacterium]